MGRRAVLGGTLALASCASLPPSDPASGEAASALLRRSASAHGGEALARVADISVSFSGSFNSFVDRLQPELVDINYRGVSDERLLRAGLVAQMQTGLTGRKQVVRRTAPTGPGTVQVWYDGMEVTADDRRSRDRRAAASLVADVDSVFLLGPMALSGAWAGARRVSARLAGTERVVVGGAAYECDVLRARLEPGFGLSDADDLVLLVDRAGHLTRQTRMSLNALDGTRGALIETDMDGYVTYEGIRWPTRWAERLLRPLPAPVHEWRLTGLDLDRGIQPSEVSGPAFTGRAASPAAAWG